ncbi:HupE/UreJ family protein [Novosphingobium sp.]|uniref:HupE/UreJ family protein n=1 Tax=Novosphingobium sp. TaxID=1874826 RepID=UPI0022BB73F4|nr:HupE/UreJ family protein [Novosphingobium sp.]MCZ8019758.1 HupE/UreJ family protein [Novosphingobium sp.]MCZ8035573.1 HupE/UreJ family protein [Novosphingobium sp.]MCZ8050887.1 HupE/UreJ family protein [Novosphingobium sp.]MCZ8059233.1 HupE/UreJ family protein [Novosphingobium sp.]MCZ8232679.1 HupE/UreJ family protein [Novosphingobium sp.]
MIALVRLALALVLLAFALPSRADELRPGYLELTQQTEAEWKLVWKAPILGGLATRAAPLLPDFCKLALDTPRLAGPAVVATGRVTCTRPLDGATVGLEGMEPGSTDALLRVAPLGRPVQTERLTPGSSTFTISAVPDRWQVARTYFVIGVEHIVAGFDHLLFVVALVLLLQHGWSVVAAASAFTIAHSITLAGTTLGLFGLPQAPVEATIALSIVFLAVEIVKAKPGEPRLSERLPWLVAFLFGLLHGFGFAGALREIGLPETDVPMALLTFNLGVEAGQLLIVAVSMAVLTLLRRFAPRALRPAVMTSTYAIGAVASFWFIERVWA